MTFESEIKTAQQLFAEIKKLDNLPSGVMKPLKYFAVPVTQFLNLEAVPEIDVIPDFFLHPLNQMMANIKDYRNPEDEAENEEDRKSSHFIKRIEQADFKLKIILEDVRNPLTSVIIPIQEGYNSLATTLYSSGKGLVEGIQTGVTKEHEITALLADYKNRFDLKRLNSEVEDYIRQGKRQLALINADDVDQFTKANFLGSLSSLRSLLAEERPSFHVELQTMEDINNPPPNGLFLAAYNLSAKMGVYIVTPNASTEFSLKIVANSENNYTCTGYTEIMTALAILTAAAGVVGGPASRFYQALASMRDLALPLKEAELNLQFLNFLIECLEKYGNVKMFATFLSLKSHVLEIGENEPNTIIICLPVSSFLSLVEATEAFKRLNEKLRANGTYSFVVGTFDLELDDAPLLLLFRAGQLVATCLDWLDFLRLEDILEKEVHDFDTLNANTSTFYPTKTKFHKEIRKLFQFSLFQKPTIVHHPKVLDLVRPDEMTKIRTAIEICTAYLSIENREERMVTSLTVKLLEAVPSFTSHLEAISWSASQKGFLNPSIFGEINRPVIRSIYLDLLFTSSNLLTKLGAFVHTLDFSIQTYNAAGGQGADHFVDLNKMVNEENQLNDFVSIDPGLVAELKAILTTPDFDKVTEALTKVEDLILHPKFVDEEGPNVGVTHLQSILSILPPIQPEDDTDIPPEEDAKRMMRWKESSEDMFHKIVTTFVKAVEWGGVIGEIEDFLAKRLILKIVDALSKIQYPTWHQTISKQFRELASIQDYDKLVEIVEGLNGLQLVKDAEHHFIWSNPPFGRMILDALEFDIEKYSLDFFNAVVQIKGDDPNEPEYKSLPPYIPIKIARILRAHLYKNEDGAKLPRKAWMSLEQRRRWRGPVFPTKMKTMVTKG